MKNFELEDVLDDYLELSFNCSPRVREDCIQFILGQKKRFRDKTVYPIQSFMLDGLLVIPSYTISPKSFTRLILLNTLTLQKQVIQIDGESVKVI